MSIELRSPSSTLTRIVPSEIVSEKIEIPKPKPRTVSPGKYSIIFQNFQIFFEKNKTFQLKFNEIQ